MISVEQLIYRKRGAIGDIKDRFSRLKNLGRKNIHPKVVMYHSVEENSEEWCPRQDYSVTPSELEEQLKYFQEEGEIVDLPEIVSWMKGNTSLPENVVALTFDDGYRNNVENALPILERYNAAATVYISTGFLSSKKPFGHCLAELLKQKGHIEVEMDGLNIEREVSNHQDRKEVYQKIRRFGKPKNKEYRQKLLEEIGPVSDIERILLDESEIKDLSENSLITIGSHSRDHVMLDKISIEDARQDIMESKRDLEEILGKEVNRFCYPYGSNNRSVRKYVRKAEFMNAVATGNRKIMPRDWDQPYRIPRIDGSNLQV